MALHFHPSNSDLIPAEIYVSQCYLAKITPILQTEFQYTLDLQLRKCTVSRGVFSLGNKVAALQKFNIESLAIMDRLLVLWLQITSSLQMELNRLYASFTARNPYFEANGGKVSIVAHSLGELNRCSYV